MTNRISSYTGVDWLTFLVSRRLAIGSEPVIDALTAMLDHPGFFQLDEKCTHTIAEWNTLFGMEHGDLN